jgi:hypothetical protein
MDSMLIHKNKQSTHRIIRSYGYKTFEHEFVLVLKKQNNSQ